MYFSVMYIGYADIAGHSPAMGRQTSAGWKKVFSSQYHSPDGAVIASFFCFDMEL